MHLLSFQTKNGKALSFIFVFLLILVFVAPTLAQNNTIKVDSKTRQKKADHSRFKELQKDFKNPHELTQACISCHTSRDDEFMLTTHWRWKEPNKDEKHGEHELGKANVLNNFCIGISSNEPRCTSCHPGYGWKDNKFDFTKSENVDCLVCHDQTGTYRKYPTKAGYPVTEITTAKGGKVYTPPDYNKIAQNIGTPKRDNCGICHYYGGGGNNVKHGDLEVALNNTTRKVDVHMGIDGQDMICTDCHETEHHKITGKLYTVASINEDRVECTQCHDEDVHENKILNNHTKRVACQTCHIPTYAKVNPTKMSWDWSQAGENRKTEDIEKQFGHSTYMKKKGEFTYGKDVVPDYIWFNGTASHTLIDDKIDPSKPVIMNTLNGSYEDKTSKIIPVKIFKAKQIYDTVNKTLVQPKVYGKKGSGAYWADFDWGKAAEIGMKSVNKPYSGEYGFVETHSYWTINHMVAPKEESLTCTDCHSKNGRLENLTGFYLPGRDGDEFTDTSALIAIILTLVGVIGHAILRVLGHKKIFLKGE